MKCLIIAAGSGSRLSAKGDIKPLVPLLGKPLLLRVMETAKSAGITDIFVVAGYKAEILTQELERMGRKSNISVTPILNNEWEKGNGLSVYKAQEYLANEKSFILLMSDHLFDQETLKELIDEDISHGEVILAVDSNILENDMVDLDDVTRVQEIDGKIRNIGKHIPDYNAFDTGMFLCTPAIFSALEMSMEMSSEHEQDFSLSGGMRILREKGNARTFDIKGRFWIDVDDDIAFEKAEKTVRKQLVL